MRQSINIIQCKQQYCCHKNIHILIFLFLSHPQAWMLAKRNRLCFCEKSCPSGWLTSWKRSRCCPTAYCECHPSAWSANGTSRVSRKSSSTRKWSQPLPLLNSKSHFTHNSKLWFKWNVFSFAGSAWISVRFVTDIRTLSRRWRRELSNWKSRVISIHRWSCLSNTFSTGSTCPGSASACWSTSTVSLVLLYRNCKALISIFTFSHPLWWHSTTRPPRRLHRPRLRSGRSCTGRLWECTFPVRPVLLGQSRTEANPAQRPTSGCARSYYVRPVASVSHRVWDFQEFDASCHGASRPGGADGAANWGLL